MNAQVTIGVHCALNSTTMPSSDPSVLTDKTLKQAEKHLAGSCSVMEELMEKHIPCEIPQLPYRPFQTLVNSIISQQLSNKAAHTIRQRVETAVGDMEPAALLATADADLRAAGLSGAKTKYLKALATRTHERQIDFDRMPSLPNEQIIDILTDVPGIGRWTAEMFLIFGLKRPDVLSVGDAGLQRAVRSLFGESADMLEEGERWRPYRTVASWYLWEFCDNRPD